MREIIGIGNDLFGDDGFGPRVIEHITENYDLSSDIEVVNAGSAPDFLLNEFLETETKHIIIVDIFDTGVPPGEIAVISAEDLPPVFPQRLTHGMSIVEIIRELVKQKDIKIDIITCQPQKVTTPDVFVGLSEPVDAAVPKAAELAVKLISQNN